MDPGRDNVTRAEPGRDGEGGAVRVWLGLGLAGYAAVLLLLRPVVPFEWDEVLFQRALDHYDVLRHSPHPPGYPVYVAAGRVARWLVGDPHLALQLVTVALAVAAVGAVWSLTRRLGGSLLAAGLAAAVVAVMPGFAFNSNVGLSDVPGAAVGVLTVLAFVAAAEKARWLPLAGLAAALTMGIRPQILPVFAPAAAWAVAGAVRSRRWRSLAAGAVAFAGTAAACWLPAVLATGAGRYAEAIHRHVAYMRTVEAGLRLPGASPGAVLAAWTVGPFVDWRFAAALWVLVAGGLVVMVRAGRPRLAAVAGSAAGLYLLAGMFSMNMTATVRYALPAMPYLAILAAGGAMAPRRVVRWGVTVAVAAWMAAAVMWAAPAWRERLRPAPVWSSLEWVAGHYDPARTRVVFDGSMAPHVAYVLGRAGFSTEDMGRAPLLPSGADAGRATLYVTPRAVAGGEVVHWETVREKRVLELAWHRYGACVVTGMPSGDRPVFSPDWQVHGDLWQLRRTGVIALPEGASPRLVTLTAGTAPLEVRRAGAPPARVVQGRTVRLPLFPGDAGALVVTAPPHWLALLAPPAVRPLRVDDLADVSHERQVVPLPAGEAWGRNDLVLFNPQPRPLKVQGRLLPAAGSGAPRGEAAAWMWSLAPGQVLTVAGVNPSGPDGTPAAAAMELAVQAPADGCGGERCAVTAFARRRPPGAAGGAGALGEGAPGIPFGRALEPLAPGAVEAPEGGELTALGAVSRCPVPVVVEVTLHYTDGSVETVERTVPPLSCVAADLKRPAARAGFRVEAAPDARVIAWGVSRDRAGADAVVVPARRREGGGEVAPAPPGR